MSNQENLRDDAASIGFATARCPIDDMWAYYVQFHGDRIPPESMNMVKYIFYSSANLVYNSMVAACRGPTPQVLAQFTLGCRNDLINYFEQ